MFKLSPEVSKAILHGKPVVALESTVITHGLPRPQNLELAQSLEAIVREGGATPATIAVIDGELCVGLEPAQLEALANNPSVRKLSSRDLAAAVAQKASGGTTVAATLRIAASSRIRVFATGGIGGVHRGSQWDISADLPELARQPLVLVCAGAKAILDLPATLEQFETLGVPVVGYGSDNYPAFYSVESGLSTSNRVDSAAEAAMLARTHWQLGGGGVLLAAPPPVETAIEREEVEAWIVQAQAEADAQDIRGQRVSPFLLARVAELSNGRSLQANLALLKNNARIAAEIAKELASANTLNA
ncbi:MAG TPA: pseudouridine-5'-phosphate glycosidase [Anaerolineales bacterium]|nr:pseudouridine-5'-phosphate glycosidase [Anaerolineales bacterium]HRQ92234.1 pseudouridine-5'-phosphate glycosidase [Anaerolineales bacterium]